MDDMREWVDFDEQADTECDAMTNAECAKYGKGMDVCLGCPVDAANRERAAKREKVTP